VLLPQYDPISTKSAEGNSRDASIAAEKSASPSTSGMNPFVDSAICFNSPGIDTVI
jgi:hypothetical protein